MPDTLERGRVRSDLDVMSRAGLPLHQFLDEATRALHRALPFVGSCHANLDPATALVSGVYKLGALNGRNDADVAWAQIEYGVDDPSALASMVATGTTAIGMHQSLGVVERSTRMAEMMLPMFDFADEARVIFRDRSGPWGSLALFREHGEAPFSGDDLDYLTSVAPAFTRGIRTGLLTQVHAAEAPIDAGPAVVIVDAADRIVQTSAGAAVQLDRISQPHQGADPLFFVQVVITGARRFASGETDAPPRMRVRARDGGWLLLHASPLGGLADRTGDVVVTIEEARPQEVIGLVADAFGLSAREREVTAMVLRGADTREIANTIHVSPYTVQDHLKSIFEKARVSSRGELVARIYFDQYLPRTGGVLGPNGWFAS